MKQQCVYGYSGNFGFSSGEALDKSCLNKRLVEFDIMRINTTNWKHNGSCQYNWYKYGGWTGTRGLDIPDKLWQFSPNRQQTIQEINILVVPFGPFTYLKPNGEWAGVDIDLLEILSEYAGLTMSQMNFTKWNGSRKEAVQELYRNDRYHLAVGAIIPHASTKGIIYTRSYYDLRLGTVILKRQQNTNLMWRFMEPFHWSVWLATVAVIILGGITSKWLDLAQTYGNGIWVVVCTIFFVQENQIVRMRNPFGRIFIISLSIFVLIFISYYTANLVSFLSPSDRSQTVFDPKVTNVMTLDRESYHWLQSQRFSNVSYVSTVEDGLRNLRQGEVDALIADIPRLRQIVLQAGPTCDLSFYNYKFPKHQYAFAVRNGAPLDTDSINGVIANVVQLNFTENSYYRHLTQNKTGLCWEELAAETSDNSDSMSSSESEISLGAESFAGVALVVLCAAGISLAMKGMIILRQYNKSSKIAVTTTRD
ncbi:uncharacterized protein LOC134177445 [Corticium candelabrum]|uniref:uncharacterized protein LOC134177445 n=1 Tax=Corticium candelabrum TaxID=121492 RepID=UPI002E261CD4|nr:uncharacterized protein LOC134177445 [Corticium candelabrum]